MNEEFLHYLWKNRLITNNLTTTSGEKLEVLQTGRHNFDSGPDFFNSRIKLGGTTWAGNVEIHINASDWFFHNHHNDEAFDSVILHVVFKNDKPVLRKNGEPIPTLELKGTFDEKIYNTYQSFQNSKRWIPCELQINSVDHFQKFAWLDNLMFERLEQKACIIKQELKKTNGDFQEVFYRKLTRNFGFKTNADAFESLAISLPLNILQKHKTSLKQIEALLFGQAGMLNKDFNENYPNELKDEYTFLAQKHGLKPIPKSRWRFMRLRPSNFPTVRVAQLSQVFYKSSGILNQILESKKLTDVSSLLNAEASDYWFDHFQFDVKSKPGKKRLGASSVQLIFINSIVPFLFVYGKIKHDQELQQKALDWLEQLKPEKNSITRKFTEIGVKPKNAMQSQALLQLKTTYCDVKRCLDCRIGHELLKPKD